MEEESPKINRVDGKGMGLREYCHRISYEALIQANLVGTQQEAYLTPGNAGKPGESIGPRKTP